MIWTCIIRCALLATLPEGSEAVGSSPQEFASHIRAEHDMWARVIKQAGIRGQ